MMVVANGPEEVGHIRPFLVKLFLLMKFFKSLFFLFLFLRLLKTSSKLATEERLATFYRDCLMPEISYLPLSAS